MPRMQQRECAEDDNRLFCKDEQEIIAPERTDDPDIFYNGRVPMTLLFLPRLYQGWVCASGPRATDDRVIRDVIHERHRHSQQITF